MKFLLVLALLAVAGCQSVPPALPLPRPLAASQPVVVPPATPPMASHSLCEQRLRQQRQTIEALMSQNDALSARLESQPSTPEPPPAVPEAPVTPVEQLVTITPPPLLTPPGAVVPPPPSPPLPLPPMKPEVLLAPNAEGVIDLAALATPASDPTNPFAVRTAGADPARDLTLTVSGIISGTRPVALVNGRALHVGEAIESLTLERCDADAAIFRCGEHRLRLAVDPKPVRIRGAF